MGECECLLSQWLLLAGWSWPSGSNCSVLVTWVILSPSRDDSVSFLQRCGRSCGVLLVLTVLSSAPAFSVGPRGSLQLCLMLFRWDLFQIRGEIWRLTPLSSLSHRPSVLSPVPSLQWHSGPQILQPFPGSGIYLSFSCISLPQPSSQWQILAFFFFFHFLLCFHVCEHTYMSVHVPLLEHVHQNIIV